MKWIKARLASYTPEGRKWLVIGVLTLIADIVVSFLGGREVTFWHGVGFAAVGLAFAYLPDAAYEEFEAGRYVAGGVVALLCVPIGLQALQNHVTYSAGVRYGDIKQTGFHNAKLENATDALKSERENIGMWRDQLKDLKARNAAILERNKGWAVTTNPEAMKEAKEAMEKAIANETARGGCKAKCETLMRQRNDLNAAIEGIKRENDLTSQIEATQRVIDSKTAAVATTGRKVSIVENVANINAQIAKLVTGHNTADVMKVTDDDIAYANMGSAGLGSLVLMILAPLAMFLAGRRRIRGHIADNSVAPRYQATAPIAPPPPIVTREQAGYVVVADDEARRIKNAILTAIAPRRLNAA